MGGCGNVDGAVAYCSAGIIGGEVLNITFLRANLLVYCKASRESMLRGGIVAGTLISLLE